MPLLGGDGKRITIVSSFCSTSAVGETGLTAEGAGACELFVAGAVAWAWRVLAVRRLRAFFFLVVAGAGGAASVGASAAGASARGGLVPAAATFFFDRRVVLLRLAVEALLLVSTTPGFSDALASVAAMTFSVAPTSSAGVALSTALTFLLRLVLFRLRVTAFFVANVIPFRTRRPAWRVGECHVPFDFHLPHAMVIGGGRQV